MVLLVHMQFFIIHLAVIQFFYGLAFFSMGLAVLLEMGKASQLRITSALLFLGLYGLLHGTFEWLEMVIILSHGHVSILFKAIAMVILGLSLISLTFFGSELIGKLKEKNWIRIFPSLLILTWAVLVLIFFIKNFATFFLNGRVLLHYLIYFPATILAAWGLILQYKELISRKFGRFAYNFLVTAILFLLMGLVRIISVPKSFFFPASFINDESFVNLVHIPAPFFRAILAVGIAFFVIRGLRVFEEESKRRMVFLEEKRRILDILQASLLKTKKPEIKELEIATHYESATLEAAIGGDFYDIIDLGNERWVFAVGDVSGKGIEAASDAFLTTQAMRCLVFEYKQPKEIVQRINRIIWQQTPSGFFVTMALLIYEASNSHLTYSIGGHPYPILCSSDRCRFLKKSGGALGINSYEAYQQQAVFFKKNDLLVLYTDGLVEAKKNGELFGDERLMRIVQENRNLSSQKLINLIMEQVTVFSKGILRDDIVLVVIKKK